jgi:hypothetical protein
MFNIILHSSVSALLRVERQFAGTKGNRLSIARPLNGKKEITRIAPHLSKTRNDEAGAKDLRLVSLLQGGSWADSRGAFKSLGFYFPPRVDRWFCLQE